MEAAATAPLISQTPIRPENCMPNRRSIDERDIDDLLASLTDRQIAELFAMPEREVAALRRQRRAAVSHPSRDTEPDGGFDGSGDGTS
jgi:hypothetical protein